MTLDELKDKVNKQFDAICKAEADTALLKWKYLTGIVDASAFEDEDTHDFKEDLEKETIAHLAWLMPGGAGRPLEAVSAPPATEEDAAEDTTVDTTPEPEPLQPEETVSEEPQAEAGVSEIEPVVAP